ncbi:MAG: FHA domain-containing protein [Myxococcales bacterium]|nr:FHA domain-containing protein [Myxococcales bacterium]
MIVCSRCSKDNQDHYKFCLGCGAELPRLSGKPSSSTDAPPRGSTGSGRSSNAPRARSAQAEALAAEPEMALESSPMQAGRPVPIQEAKSDSLPAELAPLADDTSPCPHCGAGVPENFRFCHVCGHDLVGEAGGEAPDDVPAERTSAPAVAEAPKRATTRARLILIQPDGSEGEMFPLAAGPTLIGRSSGGIFANDAYLSPEHAEFRFEGDQLVVKDMQSLNGVYIRIEADVPIELFDGSIFRVGQEILRFDAPTAPEPAADGTQHMGSPHRGYLGRVSLLVGRETTGNSYPIPPQGIHFGRERGDVVFPEDGYVSGLHCRVHSEVGHVFLTDIGSSNGTFVRVSNESYVPQGTFVLMGQQLFRAEY